MRITAAADAEQELLVPAHPTDGEWTHVLQHADGEVTFADSATDLVGVLIPGYDDIGHDAAGNDAALLSRYDAMLAVAATAQQSFNEQAISAGTLDVDSAAEDVLTTLFCDKSVPFIGLPGPNGSLLHAWEDEVPLVLIVTDYAPFTDTPRPTGRIVWLDPSLETSYLESLAALGAVDYRTRSAG